MTPRQRIIQHCDNWKLDTEMNNIVREGLLRIPDSELEVIADGLDAAVINLKQVLEKIKQHE